MAFSDHQPVPLAMLPVPPDRGYPGRMFSPQTGTWRIGCSGLRATECPKPTDRIEDQKKGSPLQKHIDKATEREE
jgi:hypothetical protein